MFLWIALAEPAPGRSQSSPPYPGAPRGVLLLNSYNLGYAWTDDLTRGVRAGLEGSGLPVELSVEFLDARRRGETLYPQMKALLEARYTPATTRLIIAADDPALQFLLDHAPDFLPGVPVVFCGASNDTLINRVPRHRFTGVREVIAVGPFIDLAVSLHAPRRIFVVSDDTLTSSIHRGVVEAYGREQHGLPMIYLDGHERSRDEILEALKRDTTPKDLVLTTPFTRDLTGQSYSARESLTKIAAASAAPTYSPMAIEVGQGLVASGVNAGFEHGLTTARLTLSALRGRRPVDIPIETFSWVAYQFDYQQLARFDIAESRLPAGAVVIGRPRSFYRENRLFIWTVAVFIVGQSAVIAALTWNVLRRRRAERELARTEADLRQSQKMDAIGRLAGGIAHDFNNLLTIITGHVSMIRDPAAGLDAKDTASSLDEVLKASSQAAALTRQLLAFSRKQVLQAKVVNLNQIVRELESMLSRLIGEHIALTTELEPQLRNMSVDPGQMQQVIVNLVVNARDAMPGGGRIVLSTRNVDGFPPQAGALSNATTPCVVLAVTDTGQGMSPDTQAQVFEPFFTTKPEGKGTGLGLAMVYGIVRQSGGWIDVASEVGAGTTFTLYFPSTPGPAAVERLPGKAPDRATRVRASVLVVEDQPEVRDLAVAALRRAGYETMEATDGDEALARFADRPLPLDLLLTDVVMPGLNGQELASRLRAAHPGLLVVFMSGYTHEVFDHQDLVGPGASFLAKPFTPAALVRQVDRLLAAQPRLHTPR